MVEVAVRQPVAVIRFSHQSPQLGVGEVVHLHTMGVLLLLLVVLVAGGHLIVHPQTRLVRLEQVGKVTQEETEIPVYLIVLVVAVERGVQAVLVRLQWVVREE